MALFVTRWPEWNPPEQEKRDWRTMTNGWNWTRLEEAMLQVRMNYSSKIPQMKWIKDAYFRLRDEERKANDRLHDQQHTQHGDGPDPQVESDRQECMSRLQALSPQDLDRAIDLAESRHWKILGSFASREILQMSWLHRFAILFALDESRRDI